MIWRQRPSCAVGTAFWTTSSVASRFAPFATARPFSTLATLPRRIHEDTATERQRDLLELSEKKLKKLTYYEILEIPTHASPQTIKKGYHAACLMYHPDKTGRSEEDYVFLSIKAAFDTLSDTEKRKSYDSTALTFDDSIPAGNEAPSDFYTTYAPVFDRNLMFDNKREENDKRKIKAPSLGNDDTPLPKVHAFYEYWIHFESWRDFSLKASQETENDLESADSRYEKRWMQKEIQKKAKAYKREEMARINLLVERAMAADPRLKRERQQQKEEKEQRKRERQEKQEKQAQKEREEAERRAKEREEREREERSTKAVAKAIKEKEKKQLRKCRQLFRKLIMTAYQQQESASPGERVWENLEEMNDDMELLCSQLTAVQLTRLTDALGGPDATEEPNLAALPQVRKHARQTKDGVTEEEIEAERLRDEARAQEAEKARLAKASRAPAQWTKEELSALAKAVKKYPPGGANRWEAIALFINNLCKPQDPRSKEECIEKYNQIAHAAAPNVNAAPVTNGSSSAAPAVAESDVWTNEQDQQLQAGLAQYPATMDKNERWAAIAKGVEGKSKKDCVQRFKAIRAAIKSK